MGMGLSKDETWTGLVAGVYVPMHVARSMAKRRPKRDPHGLTDWGIADVSISHGPFCGAKRAKRVQQMTRRFNGGEACALRFGSMLLSRAPVFGSGFRAFQQGRTPRTLVCQAALPAKFKTSIQFIISTPTPSCRLHGACFALTDLAAMAFDALLKNRTIRTYLERFAESDWETAVKFTLVLGIQQLTLDECIPNISTDALQALISA